ncbi:MAG: NAD(P)-dependent oxidoreductase [Deltaproteobacteria bacterium]
MKVLVSDNLSEVGVKILRDSEGIEVDVKVGLSPDELKAVVGEYHGMAIRGATKVTAGVIAAADNLKVVGRAGAGLDNVDIPAATKRGIVVMNTPGGNSVTTAEHTLSMMMALARNIPQAYSSMREGKWEKKKFGGTEVYNKTLGLLGLGQVGSIVANRAIGLGMQVIGYDPLLSEEQASQMGVRLGSLDEIFAQSDFISLHVPLTDETRGIVNSQNIAKMKDGVRIINCARGPVINDEELAQAVESGKVAGVAVDVYPVEPPENRCLIDLDRVICTPHLGASTKEAQENVCGDVSGLEFGPITTSFLTGLLTPLLQEDVNQVNAPAVAEDRGIAVSETRMSKSEDFLSLLRYKVITEDDERLVEGTLFGRSEPRMVRYRQFRGEFDLSGELLLLRAVDKPGVIGGVGAALGNFGVNISHFQFARTAAGGEALLFLNTDSRADDSALEALKSLDNVNDIRRLTI